MEVDAVCDGKNVFVPGIMELVERTGVHSGDSISIYPTHSISEKVKETILDYTQNWDLASESSDCSISSLLSMNSKTSIL